MIQTRIIIAILPAVFLFSCNNTKSEQHDSTEALRQQQDSVILETDYMALGKRIAAETQIVLATNLMAAINKGGVEYALGFCNANALTLTDSMAHSLDVHIKRVTDKPRNIGNQANEVELEYIQILKNNLAQGKAPEPKIKEADGKMLGYYPIMTNSMCLQCHGKKNKDIPLEATNKIKQLYPSDQAHGYSANELRGLWVVEIDPKQQK